MRLNILKIQTLRSCLLISLFLGLSQVSLGATYEPIENIMRGSSCENALTRQQVSEILDLKDQRFLTDPQKVQIHRALQFLKSLPEPSQFKWALQWERLAGFISEDSNHVWEMKRAFGPNGEILYYGGGGHALIITTEPKIQRALISSKDITGETWNGVSYPYEALPQIDIPRFGRF